MLNPTYTNPDIVKQIAAILNSEGSVQCESFMSQAQYLECKHKLSSMSMIHTYVPDKYSYHAPREIPEEFDMIKNLHFFRQLAGDKKLKEMNFFGFKHKDYILIGDDKRTKEQLHVLIDFTEEWDKEWGGVHMYKEESDATTFTVKGNCVTFMKVPKQTEFFVHYVNHHAVHHKRDVLWLVFE